MDQRACPERAGPFCVLKATVCQTESTRFETQTLGSCLQTIGIQGTTYIHPLHFHLHPFTPLPPFLPLNNLPGRNFLDYGGIPRETSSST